MTAKKYLYLGPFFSFKGIVLESVDEILSCPNSKCEKLNKESYGNFCSHCGTKLEWCNHITPYSEVNKINLQKKMKNVLVEVSDSIIANTGTDFRDKHIWISLSKVYEYREFLIDLQSNDFAWTFASAGSGSLTRIDEERRSFINKFKNEMEILKKSYDENYFSTSWGAFFLNI